MLPVNEPDEFVLDWEPHPVQEDFVDDSAKVSFFVGGIGSGKTMAGWAKVIQMTPADGVGLIVAPTYRQLRDGVLQTCKDHFWQFVDRFHETDMALDMVNGSRILLRSSTRPEDFRSLNIGWMWLDEACYHTDRAIVAAIGRLRQGCGRMWLTSSPVRGSSAHRKFVETGLARIYHCPSSSNPYLPPDYIDLLRATMTPKEQEREIEAKWVGLDGALFDGDVISNNRVNEIPCAVERYIIGVDPAMTGKRRSDRTGIVVVAIGTNGHAYVVADHSGLYQATQWPGVVARLWEMLSDGGRGDCRVVCETNQGGDLVEVGVRTMNPDVVYVGVYASVSKTERAKPVAMVYAQGWVHHVGVHKELERQQTVWTPADDESPDRMDALVWAIYDAGLKATNLSTGDRSPAPKKPGTSKPAGKGKLI